MILVLLLYLIIIPKYQTNDVTFFSSSFFKIRMKVANAISEHLSETNVNITNVTFTCSVNNSVYVVLNNDLFIFISSIFMWNFSCFGKWLDIFLLFLGRYLGRYLKHNLQLKVTSSFVVGISFDCFFFNFPGGNLFWKFHVHDILYLNVKNIPRNFIYAWIFLVRADIL